MRLDPTYPLYRDDLWSAKDGLRRRKRSIPAADGRRINLVRYAMLVVDGAGRTRLRAKPAVSGWSTFAEYERFLAGVADGLVRNAAAPSRAVRYEPLVAVSSGYDSAVAAALAADAGCKEAVTFTRGRAYSSGRGGQPDSGAPVAEALGLRVTARRPSRVRSVPEDVMAEFAACGDSFDLQFGALESLLDGRLLFTGHPGVYWRLDVPPTDDMPALSPEGSGLTEFRLRTGWVHVPVPAIGAVRHADIYRISRSPEMRPWSVGGDYDRPIARRIAETRGVPREAFGQSKKGSFRAVQLGFRDPGRAAGLRAYRPARSRSEDARRRLRSVSRLAADAVEHAVHRASYRLGVVGTLPPTAYIGHVPGASSWVVQWGNSVVAPRYRRR